MHLFLVSRFVVVSFCPQFLQTLLSAVFYTVFNHQGHYGVFRLNMLYVVVAYCELINLYYFIITITNAAKCDTCGKENYGMVLTRS